MRILYITTISLTMNAFFKPHIEMLVGEGHQVDIACNYNDLELDQLYVKLGCKFHQIDFSRSPLSIDNSKAYKQLKELIKVGNYDIVHCHTPIASVITRLVCRSFRKKSGLKVFYTAHGFHFCKGSPKLNWMIYYPIEKICSRFTDKLITINKEDYNLAKTKLKAKEVHYVLGVGVDFSRFEKASVENGVKRKEIGVSEDDFLLLSVGELSERKNHQIVIKALAKLNNPKIHYAIAGVGDKKKYLLELADSLGLSKQIHLLGFRNDIGELNHSADLFCFPSFREGLSVALMEAMVSGLPIVCSNIRGNVDLIDGEGGLLFDPKSVDSCYQAIKTVMDSDTEKMGKYNKQYVQKYSDQEVLKIMKNLYES